MHNDMCRFDRCTPTVRFYESEVSEETLIAKTSPKGGFLNLYNNIAKKIKDFATEKFLPSTIIVTYTDIDNNSLNCTINPTNLEDLLKKLNEVTFAYFIGSRGIHNSIVINSQNF